MRKFFYWVLLLGVVVVAVIVASPLRRSFTPSTDDVPPAPTSSPIIQGTSTNTTGLPLSFPDGFSVSTFAKDLPGARVLVFDGFGNLWVSQPASGVVSTLEIDKDTNTVKRQGAVFRNLTRPHGLAFDLSNPNFLYIAEEDKVSRVTLYSDDQIRKLVDLPTGGNHWTRTIGFGPDGRAYISIGSTCNVCHETDSRRAKIFSMRADGTDFREYARGLRNAVFFVWHPVTGKMWATEMGRDQLGDDIPPDELNIVEAGRNYGWPNCYGKNVHDNAFDKNTYIRNPCMEPFEAASAVDIQAHSAPLGLAFVPKGAGWPTDYEGDLLVAYHGSWNRSVPTGYKIVRHKFSAGGVYEGVEDFVTGWLENGTVHGRPVHLVFGKDGALYVSDDKAGVIYRITPTR